MHQEEGKPFYLALRHVVETRAQEMRLSPRQFAEKLGPNYRSFMYWLEGDRKFPAELLPALCLALNDLELLDVLERQAGRVAFRMPVVSVHLGIDDLKATQRLIREVGEALEVLAAKIGR